MAISSLTRMKKETLRTRSDLNMHSHTGPDPSLQSSPQQRRIALQSVGTRTLQEATLAARRKASELERQKTCGRENKLQLVMDTDSDPAANRAIKIAKAVFAELEDTARAADETNRGEE